MQYAGRIHKDAKIFVQEFGNGIPIVLLSGGPGINPVYLKPIWERLSGNYRCIVINQRGTGKSALDKIDSLNLTMEDYVNDLEALRKKLQVDKLILLGHSWGGMLAMQYASEFPTRVDQLILLGTGGPSSRFFGYFGDNIMMRLHEEDIDEMRILDSLELPNLKAIWPGYFFDRKLALLSKNSTDFNEVFNKAAEQLNPIVTKNYLAVREKRLTNLKNYKGPVTLIQGRQDPVGESTAYEIRDLLPQTQINFIEKCGHLPWLEGTQQQAKFFKLINEALANRDK